MVLAIVREAGPLGTTFMLAAAAGTAITADVGSRTVRDEIAAMQVMAVDPIHRVVVPRVVGASVAARSEEHPSELQSLMRISYADFCSKKKTSKTQTQQS